MDNTQFKIMKYFSFDHLPKKLQDVSQPFAKLALVVSELEGCPAEKTVALRKLLEAKDAAVRSLVN